MDIHLHCLAQQADCCLPSDLACALACCGMVSESGSTNGRDLQVLSPWGLPKDSSEEWQGLSVNGQVAQALRGLPLALVCGWQIPEVVLGGKHNDEALSTCCHCNIGSASGPPFIVVCPGIIWQLDAHVRVDVPSRSRQGLRNFLKVLPIRSLFPFLGQVLLKNELVRSCFIS